MPTTRPGTKLNKEGVCQACTNYDNRKNVDWLRRYRMIEELCGEFREPYGYDCAIPVSGGKDSHFLVNIVKNKLNMNPLLIRIEDGFSITDAGRHNVKNLSDTFGCDLVSYTPNISFLRRMTRWSFENLGNFPFVDYMIYNISCNIASRHGIELVFFGENPRYEYGLTDVDLPRVELPVLDPKLEQWMHRNIELRERISFIDASIENSFIKPHYMSYYVPWSGHGNYEFAKTVGFKDLTGEWDRAGTIENYDSIDSIGWQISNYLKYVKFGYGRATDIASRLIREDKMTRKEAVELVSQIDKRLDMFILNDFIDFTKYSREEFWNIINKFQNRDIFELDQDKKWRKKYPLT